MADEAEQDATEVAEQDATEVAEQESASESTTGGEAVDWQERFDAQQKVNRDLERKLKAAIPRDEAESLRAENAKLQGREAEYVAEQAAKEERARVEAGALEKANQRIVRAEVRAAAAAKLADPTDALLYIDLAQFEVGDDGEVDASAVANAVDALVKSKPYLAAQGGTTVFDSPTSRREGDSTKSQITRDQLKDLSPEQINAARAEGRLNDLLGVPK